MKFSILSASLALVASASAHCTFHLAVANSPLENLNGLLLQSLNGIGTLGPPFTGVSAVFPTASTTSSTILTTGLPGNGNGMMMLAPMNGIERIIFADIPPPNARYTEWSLTDSGALTYGDVPFKFIVFSPGSAVAHYELYVVPSGTEFHPSYPVDLVPVCI